MAYPEIAQEKLVVIDEKGKPLPVVLKVGLPYSSDNRVWKCEVQLDGLEVFRPIGGQSSFQALCLAINFLHARLKQLESSGFSILYDTDKEPVQLNELFGKQTVSG